MFKRKKRRCKHVDPSHRIEREIIAERGREGNKRGKENEQRLIDAYEVARKNGKLPKWLIVVRKATKEEDHEWKTDAVAITDVGPIRIQIKSSERACMAFMETIWGKYNLCFVVRPKEPPEKLVGRTLPKIAARRHARIQNHKRPR